MSSVVVDWWDQGAVPPVAALTLLPDLQFLPYLVLSLMSITRPVVRELDILNIELTRHWLTRAP